MYTIDWQTQTSRLDCSSRLLESVGHFIRMHVARPHTLRSRMYKWIEDSLIGVGSEACRNRMPIESSSSERTLLQGSEIIDCIANDSFLLNRYMSYLELELNEIILTGNAEFSSAEETIALKLMQTWTEYCKLRGQLRRGVKKFVASLANIEKTIKPLRIKKNFEVVLDQCKRVTALRQDLIAIAKELQSIRNEQEFNSTSVIIELIRAPGRKDNCVLVQSVNELLERMKTVYNELLHKQLDDSEQVRETHEIVIDYFEHCLERELEVMQSSSKTYLYAVNMNPNGCQVTDEERLPVQEQERRAKLDRWLRSLRIQILIGREYYYNCDIRDCIRESRTHPLQMDLSDHVSTIPVPIDQDPIEIDLRLVESTHQHSFAASSNRPNLFGSFRVLGFAKVSVGTQPDRISRVTTNLINSEQHSVAVLRHKHQIKELRGNFCGRRYDLDMCRKVDLLYRRCFIVMHSYDSVETKLFHLMNRIDSHRLAELAQQVFDGKEPQIESFEKVILNRFCSCLDAIEDEPIIAGRSRLAIRRSKHPESDFSTRRSSLGWRRATQLHSASTAGRQVRDGDSQVGDASLSGDSDPKLRWIDLNQGELLKMGYKSIDLLRKRASEYVRQCERHLKWLIYLTSQKSSAGSDRNGLHIEDLLHEPKIRTMDYLWRLMQVTSRMVPKRGAPRPLKPKRKTAAKSSLRAAATVALMATRRSDGYGDDEVDVESGQRPCEPSCTSARRQRAVTATLQVPSAATSLRLVVTIQQVANSPLRVVRQSSLFNAGGQPMAARPSSPFPSAFGGAPGGTMSPQSRARSPVQPLGGYLLALPTTYVEAVFQRNRLATSLAYGKDPTWNETLFFPIESGGSGPSGNRRRLVDEYLQLNLYDCQCHGAATTLNSTDSLIDDTMAASIGATSQLVTTQQRIERHLLGSLRVPLTTLLTSGRLEGSFALNQPLLLDNYQFEQETPTAAAQAMPTTLSPSPFQQQQSASRRQERRRQRQLLRHSQTTYLSLFITIDPPVSIPMRLHLPAAVCCSGSAYLEHFYLYCRLFEQVTSTLQSQRQRQQQQRRRLRGHMKEQQQQQQQPILRPIVMSSIVTTNRPQLSPRADRNVRAVCWNESAKLCLISAYLSPLEPPGYLMRRVMQVNLTRSRHWTHKRLTLVKWLFYHTIARFVSLMSPLKYGLFENRLLAPSLWFTCRDLLENMVGGNEEKAVLLCNYFLHLGRSSALLFGDSVPEGRCVYVVVWRDQLKHYHSIETDSNIEPSDQDAKQMMQMLFPATDSGEGPTQVSNNFLDRLPILIKPNTIEIWDPNSGRCYAVGSGSLSQLPLISVGSIATVENVYANIQTGEQPHEISFDIRSRRCWLPLLERGPDRLQANPEQQQVEQSDTMDRLTKQLGGSLAGAEKLLHMSWRKQLTHLEQARRCVDSQMLWPLMTPAPDKSAAGVNSNEPMTRAQCDELRDSIERQVRANLINWRSDRPTYMNRTLSRLISERLARFEQLLCRQSVNEDEIDDDDDSEDLQDDTGPGKGDQYDGAGSDSVSSDWRTQLAELLRSEVLALGRLDTGMSGSYLIDQFSLASGVQAHKKLVSFPLNLSYTNISTIMDLLYASGVHNADLNVGCQSGVDPSTSTSQAVSGSASRAQFLIACHVESYPARVLSVWMYVGAMITMQ